jgi:hypothetical protein
MYLRFLHDIDDGSNIIPRDDRSIFAPCPFNELIAQVLNNIGIPAAESQDVIDCSRFV